MENKTEVVDEYKWGKKLDGTPKKQPGRKASGVVTQTRNRFVYLGKIVGRGQPSIDQLRGRRQITVPADFNPENYDPAVHGLGVRLPEDDVKVAEFEARELARKAKKVKTPEASSEGAAAQPVSAVGTEVASPEANAASQTATPDSGTTEF